MNAHLARGEVLAGLLYDDPLVTDLHVALNNSDTPLNQMGAAQLFSGARVLDKLNTSLR